MAIYHLHVKLVQRSKGQNVVASAAYRHAAKMKSEKEGKTYDYTNKPDVIHSDILIPENSPAWLNSLMTDEISIHDKSAFLWNFVEGVEKRVDAQLAREIEFSLPVELDEKQNLELTKAFIQDQFVLRGMVADFAIHWDKGNPHVHVLLSTRELTEEGFGNKVVAWNNKAMLQEWRSKWAEYANFYLRMNKHVVRIDSRSYAEQGIHLTPGIHEGKAVHDMEIRGIDTDIMAEANQIRHENLNRISENPTVLLDKISSQYEHFRLNQVTHELTRYVNDATPESKATLSALSAENLALDRQEPTLLLPSTIAKILGQIEEHESVFTDKDIARAANAYSTTVELFAKAISEIKSSPDLIFLGAGDDGRDRFTTRSMFDLENELQKNADLLRDMPHIKLSSKNITTALNTYEKQTGKTLTDEQQVAVKHILQSSSISCVVGRAGTGKSFSLGAAKAVWGSAGLTVLGVALSGIGADGLAKDALIDSRTIESFRLAIANGSMILTRQHVVVMDEAGMTDSFSMKAVLDAVKNAGAKLVLVGDYAQIQPVGPGASFRAMLERLGFAEIRTVYRQHEAWQREATNNFSSGNVALAVSAYSQHSCVQMAANAELTMTQLVENWFETRAQNEVNLSELLIVAHRNEDVALLNQRIRASRVLRGEIGAGMAVSTKLGALRIAEGDRLLFTKNDRALGVSNGRFGTIQAIALNEQGSLKSFRVILDGAGTEVDIDPTKYQEFTLGYAATVHKVQGMTVDNTFVYAGGYSWNRHLTYVAMTRHRKSCYLYADKTIHKDEKTLIKNLSKMGIKDSLLDYPLAFAERRNIDTEPLLKTLPTHLAHRLDAFKERLREKIYQEFAHARVEKAISETIAHEKQRQTREDARLVAGYVDDSQAIGKAWHELQHKLYALGLNEMPRDAKALECLAKTDEYQALQTATTGRNVKAFDIMQEPLRYQKALELYQLDLSKLESQADQHIRLLEITVYLKASRDGLVVHRDKMAANVITNIKAYYPVLKTLSVDTKVLRIQAIAHSRRRLLARLPVAARTPFYIVEDYRQKVQQIGVYYARHMKHEGENVTVKREHALCFEKMGLARDKLAFQILSNRADYDKALDFYQIGLAVPHFQESPTEAQCRRAEENWYKLQNHASRYEYRDRVERYLAECTKGLTTARMQLAVEIRQETKAHFAAMMQLGLPKESPLWLQLWNDEQRYLQLEYFKTLTPEERGAFVEVEAYLAAKRSNGIAWRELFETKNALKMDDKDFYQQLAGFAKPFTTARNTLAAAIAKDPVPYQKGLTYLKVSPEELNKFACTHHCEIRVDHFAKEKDPILRGLIAIEMLSDLKAHSHALRSHNIAFKEIYRFAKISNSWDLFNGLSVDEKRHLRRLDKYQRVNRLVGKTYGALKARLANGASKEIEQTRLKATLSRYVGLRTRLAHQIMVGQNSFTMMSALGEYQASPKLVDALKAQWISWDKIALNADKYKMMKQEVSAWHADYQSSLSHLAQMTPSHTANQKQIMHTAIDWSIERKDCNIDAITQKIIARADAYQCILAEFGIDKAKLSQTQQLIGRINLSVNQWFDLQAHEKSGKTPLRYEMEDQKRLIAVRKIVRGAKPIADTLAARYLQEHRGIFGEVNNKTFLYHPNLYNWMTKSAHPALVVLAQDSEKHVCGLQAIFLNPITAKKAALGDFTKLSRGFTSDGGLVHLGVPGGMVALAEGPETALSIAQARPEWTVYVTFGVRNFEKVALKTNASQIMICADNDGLGSGTEKAVVTAAMAMAAQGKDVWVAMPEKPLHMKKWDFNDALQIEGVDAVLQSLNNARLYQRAITAESLEHTVLHAVAAISNDTVLAHSIEPVTPSIIEMYSLEDIVKTFVEMEIEQSRLIREKHSCDMTESGRQLKQELSPIVIKHSKEVAAFAVKAMSHPDVTQELALMKGFKPASLAELGGYASIHERFSKGEFLPQDVKTVIRKIYSKAQDQSRAESRDRSRGGRSL